jgi:hypothetical protein
LKLSQYSRFRSDTIPGREPVHLLLINVGAEQEIVERRARAESRLKNDVCWDD